MFSLIDVILIATVAIFGAIGFMMGLLEAIGALIGIVVGAWLAGQYSDLLAGWLLPFVLGNVAAAKVIAFIAIFSVSNRLFGLVFWLIYKFFRLAMIIPFLSAVNRLAGFFFGLVEGMLATGLAVYAIVKFAPNIPWLLNGLNGSRVAHFLVFITQFLSNLVP